MTMTLIDPFHVSTNVTNIDENSFSLPGTYTLSIIGYCGNRVCKCSITFIKQNDCCKDESIFEQHVLSAITVTPDPAKCKVTVQVGNLPACDYIEKINWGDGTSSVGPFVTGDMPMHSYNASGVYSISIIAVEEDPAMGMYCFVKLIKKSIELNCRLIGSINPGIRPSVNDAIRVFPNPTSGLFIVELSEVPIEGTRMRVVNLAGQVMMERMAVTDIKVQSVNATSLPQGLYFIQVITSGKPIAVEKFIKR
ncbi:MAG: T9SS type A sorting domain-containing protein [Saprospiraceae bacterium]|nr:T9SS type A sorting domain-containing protein [Saprospiraceae bacterium]